MKKPELRYLFGAHLKDGSEYFQTPEDVSIVDASKSAFYDLSVRDGEGRLLLDEHGVGIVRPDIELFQLEGQGHRYLVDLRDGSFQVDDVPPFFLNVPMRGQELSLVYFRRYDRYLNANLEEVLPYRCEYHFGWKYRHVNAAWVTMILI